VRVVFVVVLEPPGDQIKRGIGVGDLGDPEGDHVLLNAQVAYEIGGLRAFSYVTKILDTDPV
jgi:hypothetical protein